MDNRIERNRGERVKETAEKGAAGISRKGARWFHALGGKEAHFQADLRVMMLIGNELNGWHAGCWQMVRIKLT
jgi:hypothetical protein